jgi:hypothetical protein
VLLPRRCSGCGRRRDRCDCIRLDRIALELYRLFGGAAP